MTIDIFPIASDSPRGRYQRLELPLEVLEATHPDEFNVCWTCEPKPGTDEHPSVVLGQRVGAVAVAPDARWLEFCTDPRYFTVYEIDDDILSADSPDRLGTVHNILWADHVITSTPNLANKMADLRLHGDPKTYPSEVTVAPNCVADGNGFIVGEPEISSLAHIWADVFRKAYR